jgi:hypothetical protein
VPTLQLADPIGAPTAAVEVERERAAGQKAVQRAAAPAMIGHNDFGKAIADARRVCANLQRPEPRHKLVVSLTPFGRGTAKIIQSL